MSVHPLQAALGTAALLDIAAGLARAESLWRPHAEADAERRRSVRVLATDTYEVWVLSWAPGQGVSLHDHGPSAGAFVVLEGELTEVVVTDGAMTSVARPSGSSTALPVGIVHDVLNSGPAAATSLHVYSPPLTIMGVWDAETLTRVAVEHLDPGGGFGHAAVA
jgi:mannose-6-phosphate isomerase-like protein (cupin superfamily)